MTLKYYTDENFISAKTPVNHGFFTRKGGVSEGVYAGLNCGQGSKDDSAKVQKNLQLATQEFGTTADRIFSPYQHHSADVLYINEPNMNRIKADASVTDTPGIYLSVVTADCAPVLFYAPNQNNEGAPLIGAAHAGWKGALAGILENTVSALCRLGAEEADIKACIGPCLAKNSYEVSEEFIERLLNDNPQNEVFFHAGSREGHAQFDLPGYCAARLAAAGLKHVILMDKDTYTNEDEFYSYRRMTHKGEDDYGRQISLIGIKEDL